MKITATYSPEDNKIRLYPLGRLPADVYERVRAAGFIWAPKQELFVAPAWGIEREDLALELAGEIDDEDKGLVERAEERAERFEDYSESRTADAANAQARVAAVADFIPMGQPILVGHHSEKRHRRDIERIADGMRKSVKNWETAEYWKQRAAAAVCAAEYKERPDVRARRIKKLEAELRKVETNLKRTRVNLTWWTDKAPHKTREVVLAVLNGYDHGAVTLPDGSDYWSAWGAVNDGKLTPEEVRAQRLATLPASITRLERWERHYSNRLAYERAMLAADGGTVADKTGPEVGGACRCWASPSGGWSLIQKVNKVSVTLLDNWGNGGRDFTRTIPFDKLKGVMTKAEVADARAAGRLHGETPRGFVLATGPVVAAEA